jgi:hypothetical protein
VVLTLVTALVALAGTVGLISFFQSRDDAGIEGTSEQGGVPGEAAPDETDPRLQAGNVILTFRRPEDGPVLRALAEDLAGKPSPELEDAGAAVIVLPRPNQSAGPVVAHARGRRLVTEQATDPEVRRFVEYWLARGPGA